MRQNLPGLDVDAARKAAVLGGKPPYIAPDATTKYQHESLHGAWWIAELWPKVVSVREGDGWKRSIYFNLGRRRYIPDGIAVHESVDQHLAATQLGYQPSNLPKDHSVIVDRWEQAEAITHD